MNKGRNTALVLLIIIIIVGALLYTFRNSAWLAPLLGSGSSATAQQEVGTASYLCDGEKTINATYYQGTTTTPANTNTAPIPNGSVGLVLSDGRSLTLPQTVSGSGIRYANADESVVFWNKGNTAFITEGANQTQTFANCVATSNISGQESWSTYVSAAAGYSVRYPQGYKLDTSYAYQALGPGKTINGIKLTINPAMATGTNLSNDSGVSIEQLPASAASCTADLFLGDQVGSTTVITENGTTYSVAQGSDAGAGNLYNETVYAIPGSSQCTAIRYYIHSSQIGNYPPGTVTAFNQPALLKDFDGIRASLVLSK